MKKLYSIVGVLFVAVIVFGMLNLNFSSNVASDSLEIKDIQARVSQLQEDNQILQAKILKFQTMEMLASRASDLGFVEANNYISLHEPVEVAVRQ